MINPSESMNNTSVNDIKTVCICGGGSLGHVIAGVLAARQDLALCVNILTRQPSRWSHELTIHTPESAAHALTGHISTISAYPEDVVPQADLVLVCLPGHLISDELLKIRDHLKPGTFVGCVFSSTGFFFEALKILPEDIKLWGFQRVPFIARTLDYGHSAKLLGYKSEHKIAVERATDAEKETLRQFVAQAFGCLSTSQDCPSASQDCPSTSQDCSSTSQDSLCTFQDCPTVLLGSYLEASITNSNPLLHTSRLYTMFHDWQPGIVYPKNYLFYEEWTTEAAQLYMDMDDELSELIQHLPVDPHFLAPVLEYYESHDAASLARKLSSIPSFCGILSPMKQVAAEEGKDSAAEKEKDFAAEKGESSTAEEGKDSATEQWIPDFSSRYFVEDFGCSLRYIWELSQQYGLTLPNIDRVYRWGAEKIKT